MSSIVDRLPIDRRWLWSVMKEFWIGDLHWTRWCRSFVNSQSVISTGLWSVMKEFCEYRWVTYRYSMIMIYFFDYRSVMKEFGEYRYRWSPLDFGLWSRSFVNSRSVISTGLWSVIKEFCEYQWVTYRYSKIMFYFSMSIGYLLTCDDWEALWNEGVNVDGLPIDRWWLGSSSDSTGLMFFF